MCDVAVSAHQSCLKSIKKVGIMRVVKEMNLEAVGPGMVWESLASRGVHTSCGACALDGR